jgi:DHA1 family multidrug resistance protein-like MFS transporter
LGNNVTRHLAIGFFEDGPAVVTKADGKRLLVLLVCLFVAMVGFGITLPVLPFYAERLALRGRSPAADVAVQVALLTAVYPLTQLLFAPLWGHWSDSLGRRRLVLVGIGGAAVGQVLFALANSLAALYVARVAGGLLSAALFPAAAAYVADSTSDRDRGRGMAWLGTAVSLGVVVGPALGGALARTGWQLRGPSGVVLITSFAVPFLAAGALGAAGFVAALGWLPESRVGRAHPDGRSPMAAAAEALRRGPLRGLLSLAVAGQFGLTMFEATFALYAKRMWNYGPAEVGAAFMICGLVMATAQTGITAALARRVRETTQVAVGFGLVGASLGLLPFARVRFTVLAMVAMLALGVALITPNVTALITTRGGARTGGALGVQSAANSLGQLGGTVLGGVLLGWNMEAPFVVAATLLLMTGIAVAWQARAAQRVSVAAAGAAAHEWGDVTAPGRPDSE